EKRNETLQAHDPRNQLAALAHRASDRIRPLPGFGPPGLAAAVSPVITAPETPRGVPAPMNWPSILAWAVVLPVVLFLLVLTRRPIPTHSAAPVLAEGDTIIDGIIIERVPPRIYHPDPGDAVDLPLPLITTEGQYDELSPYAEYIDIKGRKLTKQ